VERKARQYIDSSDGKIQAVLILDLQYPGMKKAWVSLRVADDPSSHWIQHHDLYHDDALDQQPDGQVDLYLSDLVGSAGLPAAYCRPSTAELAAGITRFAILILNLEADLTFPQKPHDHSDIRAAEGQLSQGTPLTQADRIYHRDR
jgi:hypothetical protein